MYENGKTDEPVKRIDPDALGLIDPEAPSATEIRCELPGVDMVPPSVSPQMMETEIVQPPAELEPAPPPVAPSIAPFFEPEAMQALNIKLLRSIHRRYGSQTKAGRSPEDILSEVWIGAILASRKERYRNIPPNEFETVIWAITANKIYDGHRRAKSDLADPIGIDYEVLPESEQANEPSAQQVAIEGMTMQAIADGIRERTINKSGATGAKVLAVMFLDPATTNQELMGLGLASTPRAASIASHRAFNVLEQIAGEVLGIEKRCGRRKPRTRK